MGEQDFVINLRFLFGSAGGRLPLLAVRRAHRRGLQRLRRRIFSRELDIPREGCTNASNPDILPARKSQFYSGINA